MIDAVEKGNPKLYREFDDIFYGGSQKLDYLSQRHAVYECLKCCTEMQIDIIFLLIFQEIFIVLHYPYFRYFLIRNRIGGDLFEKKDTLSAPKPPKKDTFFGREAPEIGAEGAVLENFGNFSKKNGRKMQ